MGWRCRAIVSIGLLVSKYLSIYAPGVPGVQHMSAQNFAVIHTICACGGGGCATGCCAKSFSMLAREVWGPSCVSPAVWGCVGIGFGCTTWVALKGLRVAYREALRSAHSTVPTELVRVDHTQ